MRRFSWEKRGPGKGTWFSILPEIERGVSPRGDYRFPSGDGADSNLESPNRESARPGIASKAPGTFAVSINRAARIIRRHACGLETEGSRSLRGA